MKFNSEQIKYILMTLSNTPSSDIDSDEFEVEWGSDDGVEGFAAHSVSDTAGIAIECIESIEMQRDHLQAQVDELFKAAENLLSNVVFVNFSGEWNTSFVEDADLTEYCQPLQDAIKKITGETK